MKIVVFGPDKKVGLLVDARILDLHLAAQNGGAGNAVPVETFASLLSLIEGEDAALDAVGKLEAQASGSEQPGLWSDAANVRLHAPWPGRRVMMAGTNHPEHIASFYTNFGKPMTAEEARANARRSVPHGFWAVSEPVGPGDPVTIPSRANGLFDFEAEPAIVLSRTGKRISGGDLRKHVWGVTIIADWSVRNEGWPTTPAAPFMFEKNFDTSKTIGPCIAVGEVDPQEIDMTTHVNGVLRQSFNSSEMIWSFGEILEYVSRDLTFRTGEIISAGTGSGSAVDQMKPGEDLTKWPRDLYLKAGDMVTMASPQIGSFTSPIVAEA